MNLIGLIVSLCDQPTFSGLALTVVDAIIKKTSAKILMYSPLSNLKMDFSIWYIFYVFSQSAN